MIIQYIFLIVALCINEFAYAQQIYPKDLQNIKDQGKLRVCQYKGQRSPFMITNEKGERVGLDMDIARGLAKSLDVPLEMIYVNSFNDVIDSVANGICDAGVSKLSLTPERSKKVLYTKPYVMASKVLMINRVRLQQYLKTGTESLEEIIKKNHPIVYVLADSSYVDFVERLLPDARVMKHKSWEKEGAPNVYAGHVFAAFTDEFDSWLVLETIPDAPLKLLMVTLKNENDPLYIITGPDKFFLRDYIQRYLEINNINYTHKDIIKKYRKEITKYISGIREKWLDTAAAVERKGMK